MLRTEIDRRALLAALIGTAVLTGAPAMLAAAGPERRFVGIAKRPGLGFGAVAFEPDGAILFEAPLEGRGHGIAVAPDRSVVAVCARRPGAWIRLLDGGTGQMLVDVPAPPARVYAGHGLFTPDGARFLSVEIAVGAGTGVIGIHDVRDGFRRVGEVATGGEGPHEMVLLDDGATLAIAHGGLAADPATGADLKPYRFAEGGTSLAFIDLASGRLIVTLRPLAPDARLGIRHLAPLPGRRVAAALQSLDERDAGDARSLIWIAHPDTGAAPLPIDETLWANFDGYVGSVVPGEHGRSLAFSSPRGGLVLVADVEGRGKPEIFRAPDLCGLAPLGEGFLASSGFGGLFGVGAEGAARLTNAGATAGLLWDNHLAVL